MTSDIPMVREQIVASFPRVKFEKIHELRLLDPTHNVLVRLVQIFYTESKDRIPEMKNYVSSENFDGLAKVIHRFRSTAYNLGADRAAEITKRIDFVIGKNLIDKTELNQLISALEKECEAAHLELSSLLPLAS